MTRGAEPPIDLLVVGAGPTGLTAAAEAARYGLSVRIIDRKPSRSTFSKALVVHSRTLETFEAMGIAGAMLAEGVPFAALNVHGGRGGRPVRVDLLDLPWGDTDYPFWLSLPQYATERILQEHLNGLGTRVEWQSSLESLRQHSDHVEARLSGPDGSTASVRARWVLGSDGGRSRTRDLAGLHLQRADAGATFLLADVKTTTELPEDEGWVHLHPEGLLLIVPMPEPGRWRIIAHLPPDSPRVPAQVDAAFVDDLIRRRTGLAFGAHDVSWQSAFDLSHGLADHYRRGRIFIAGDAAHVHSPVGGQGLNTGIQDAHNLVWKLAAARDLDPVPAAALLDSFEAERRPVAAAMVRTTARTTGVLTRRNGAIRTLSGLAAPRLMSSKAVRSRLGRNVGMLELRYGGGARAGGAAGRRMPNPRLRTGERLYQRLDPIRHTWVVRGRPEQALDPHEPRWRGLPVVSLSESALVEGTPSPLLPVTLVRPDRYVAAAGGSAEAVWRSAYA